MWGAAVLILAGIVLGGDAINSRDALLVSIQQDISSIEHELVSFSPFSFFFSSHPD